MQKLSDTEDQVANKHDTESSFFGKSHLQYPLCIIYVLKHHELASLVI